MKMNWWHNEPIYMEGMLISSLCWNLTMGTVFIPHATAILSINCLKERKDGKTQQQQTPTICQNESINWDFWRSSKDNFLLLLEWQYSSDTDHEEK